jgi:hypothetical protein
VLSGTGDAAFGPEVESGLCDWGEPGAEVTAAGLAGDGRRIIAGTCAGVFSVDGVDCLSSVGMGGTFASDGVDDGLFADGAAGCASSNIGNGEI